MSSTPVVLLPLHWTKALKAENKSLKASSEAFRQRVWAVLESRFAKNNEFGDGGRYSLGYQAALQEIAARLRD